MAVIDFGADTNTLFNQLTQDINVVIPNIDLSGPEYTLPVETPDPMSLPVTKVDICDVTTRSIGGTGAFDALMEGFAVHLKGEYEANRITGAEYTKAYIAASTAAMGSAVQFALQKDLTYWQAMTARISAMTARVQLQTAKAQMLQALFGALRERAGYALTKAQMMNASMEYRISEYTHTMMQPIQLDMLNKQSAGLTLQNEGLSLDNEIKDFNLNSIQPQQLHLLEEQTETARAQTLDTRTDGTTAVSGSVGKQKELYSQQITSYQRKTELDIAKIWSDAWTVQKTIDEGLIAPANFSNANVDAVLSRLRTQGGMF